MKHSSSREFFAYWDAKRGDARAPDRSEIEPGAVRELLGDIFVLAYDNEAGYPFRVAGTRLSALNSAEKLVSLRSRPSRAQTRVPATRNG